MKKRTKEQLEKLIKRWTWENKRAVRDYYTAPYLYTGPRYSPLERYDGRWDNIIRIIEDI